MYKKWRKVLIVLLSCLLFCTGGASLANIYAKYVIERGGSGDIGGDNDFDLPYVVERPLNVHTQEELFNALSNGYTNIKIAEEMKNPLIITEGAVDLKRSLIIDLNGAEIQRNSRDPILNIPSGVTLTITDSSEGKGGGLYNPVGSVLNVNGGSLQVLGGKFESGPRYWEYYSAGETQILEGKKVEKAWTIKDGKKDALRDGDNYPIIEAVLQDKGGRKYADGNIYFDKACGSIPADTYCYVVSSDGMTSGDEYTFNPGEASFVYSYYVKPITESSTKYEFLSETKPTEGVLNQDYIEVMVYGYEKDIETAVLGTGTSMSQQRQPNYAAIKMSSGNLLVNAPSKTNYETVTEPKKMGTGCFISYFGVAQTSCIYMSGGRMEVLHAGAFVTANPENFGKDWGADGDSEKKQTDADGVPLDLNASMGRGSCISTSADNTGSLIINDSVFRSYNLNCIQMNGGNITVNGGKFYKYSSIEKRLQGRAAIYVQNGNCNVTDAEFYISSTAEEFLESDEAPKPATDRGYQSENVYGLYSTGGSLDIKNSNFHIDGNYATAIYSSSSSSIFLSGVQTKMHGEHLCGVFSEGGIVRMTPTYVIPGDEKSEIHRKTTFQLGGKKDDESITNGSYSYGIYAKSFQASGNATRAGGQQEATGTIFSRDVDYTIDGKWSHGVFSEAGDITLFGGTMTLKSINHCYGIAAVSRDGEHPITIDVLNANIVVGGVFVAPGTGNGAEKDKTVKFNPLEEERESTTFNVAANTTISAVPMSIGLYLANVQKGNGACYVSLYRTNLHSIDMGVGVREGDVFIQGGGTIEGYNSSAIAVDHGNVYTGIINTDYQGGSATSNSIYIHLDKLKNDLAEHNDLRKIFYEGTVDGKEGSDPVTLNVYSRVGNNNITGTLCAPNPQAGKYFVKAYDNNDGVYVADGGFFAVENVKVDFIGKENYVQSTFADQYVRSYAVRIKSVADKVAPKATFLKCDIVNQVGGGVSVEGSDAEVVLGDTESENEDIKIVTQGEDGNEYNEKKFTYYMEKNIMDDDIYKAMDAAMYDPVRPLGYATIPTWRMFKNKYGGTALNITGGTLTVYAGVVSAKCGTGIEVSDAKRVDIHDGYFIGSLNGLKGLTKTGYRTLSGPGAYYGLRVLGQSTVNIYDGVYGGGNGGAFFSGTPIEVNSTITTNAKVYIYKGIFGEYKEFNENIWGREGLLKLGYNPTLDAQDGFNIYPGVDIVMGAHGTNAGGLTDATSRKNAIQVQGRASAMAINPWDGYWGERYPYNYTYTYYPINLDIYYGSYRCPKISGITQIGWLSHTTARTDITINVYNRAQKWNNAASDYVWLADKFEGYDPKFNCPGTSKDYSA